MVEYGYYKVTYKGVDIPDDTLFEKLAVVSEDIVKYLTKDAEETENIKKAQCAQIEFLYQNGGVNAINGKDSSQFTSESIGGYSYSRNTTIKSGIKYVNGLPLSPMLKVYLGKLKGGALINVG